MTTSEPLPWFRFYRGTTNDIKLRTTARMTGLHRLMVIGAWSALLDMASNSPVYGGLYISETMPLSLVDIADELGLTDSESEAIMNAFITLQMIEKDEKGGYVIKNWSKRQFTSDNSTARVRNYRDRHQDQAPQKNNEEEKRNDDETLHDCFSNEVVTPPDTDTDSESESEITTAQLAVVSSNGGGRAKMNIEVMRECGFGINKTTTEIAHLEHVTPDLIRGHAALIRSDPKSKPGLAILRIKNNEPAPAVNLHTGHIKTCRCEDCVDAKRKQYAEWESDP